MGYLKISSIEGNKVEFESGERPISFFMEERGPITVSEKIDFETNANLISYFLALGAFVDLVRGRLFRRG